MPLSKLACKGIFADTTVKKQQSTDKRESLVAQPHKSQWGGDKTCMHGMFSSEQVLTTDPHNDGAGFAILIIAALMI